ncbi:MAG: flagellin [Candidatus Auribacterota bacterium]|jgi:flagellin|nr:flagellin [Candidatus Auribacterota bacterium]
MGDLARINTNVSALRSFQTLSTINTRLTKAQERISTGKTVNRSSDSPSDYYITRMLQKDINAVQRNNKNIERGINFLQTNDSRLAQVANILMEMSDMANQANSIAVTSAEKEAIQQDLTQLSQEILNILQSGVSAKLYTGFTLGGLHNAKLTGNLTINPLATLTIDGVNISVTGNDLDRIQQSINNIDNALNVILRDEERLGSFIKRLQTEYELHEVERVNLRASLSSIQDADLAEEQMELTKLSILQQAALAMLTQANSAPNAVMSLFQ